jgi:hypothetical protein
MVQLLCRFHLASFYMDKILPKKRETKKLKIFKLSDFGSFQFIKSEKKKGF